MITLSNIKDWTDVIEFTDGYYEFKKDNRARASLNKTLETNYRAVYREKNQYKRSQWKSEALDWSGETFYVVTEKGRVIEFKNSDWAWFEEVAK